MDLTLSTTVSSVEKWYESKRPGHLRVSAKLGSGDLVRLVERHKDRPYSDALLSVIVNSRAATPRVLRAALAASGNSASVANAIATRRDTPRSLLQHLLTSESSSVREHAQLALLLQRINAGLSERTLDGLLAKHESDGGIDLGVRAAIASNPKTPRKVLERLSVDDADFVALAARRTMRARRSAKLRAGKAGKGRK